MTWLEILITLIVLLISMKLFGYLKSFGAPKEDPFMWEAERQLLEALDNNDLPRFKQIFEFNKFSPNHVCRTKNPLLQRAVAKKHSIPFLEYLLEKGADINFTHGNSKSPVFEACWHDHYPQAELLYHLIEYDMDKLLLIKRGAKLDTEFKQMFDMNCLDVACHYQNYEIVYLLLVNGFTTDDIRRRHELFKQKFQGMVTLIDSKIQELMDFFDSYLPSTCRMVLLRKMQQRDPKNTELSKYSDLLADMLPEEFEEIVKYYTPEEPAKDQVQQSPVVASA